MSSFTLADLELARKAFDEAYPETEDMTVYISEGMLRDLLLSHDILSRIRRYLFGYSRKELHKLSMHTFNVLV